MIYHALKPIAFKNPRDGGGPEILMSNGSIWTYRFGKWEETYPPVPEVVADAAEEGRLYTEQFGWLKNLARELFARCK